MKKYIFLLILQIIVLSSCHKDEVVSIASIKTSNLKVETLYTSAKICWNIVCDATIDAVILEYSTDSAFASYKEARMNRENSSKENYSINIDSLAEGTIYYIRGRCINKINSCNSEIETFSTRTYHLAQVKTDSITNVSISTATINATLYDTGTDKEVEVGFYFATHQNVTKNDSLLLVSVEDIHDSLSFSYPLTNLEDNKTFYVRAYAKNVKGVAWGEELTFKTIEIFLPTVENTKLKNITYTSAVCSSNVSSNGGSAVLEQGFCYSTSHNPTVNNEKIKCETSDFNTTISNLSAGTTYYVRAYARNSKGTAYGPENSFSTKAYTVPTVTTPSVSNITQNTVTCMSSVTNDGGQAVTGCGFCYSTSHNPTTNSNKVTCSSSNFSATITNLSAGLTYYVRAYATNSKGTAYSAETSFTIPSAPPAVQIKDFAIKSTSSVTCTGNIISSNSTQSTEYGFCWSTSQNPTINSYHMQGVVSSNSFSANLTGLNPNVTYYVRAYARNSIGISYSSNELEVSIPVIYYTGSEKLTEIDGSSVEGLHPNAFGGVSILSHEFISGTGTILFNKKLSTIGVRAFSGCRNMTSITIPNEVTSIGAYAFWQCNSLISIVIPNTVTNLGSGVFYNCYNLNTVNIPDKLTKINSYTFHSCRALTQINIPQGVTVIGESAFSLCHSLSSIAIPDGVVSIGEYAFFGCTVLKSIIVGQGVKYIKESAFSSCRKLESITCKAISPPTCGSGAFEEVSKSIPVYVPFGYVSAYKSAYGWMDFSNIKPYY